jgi:hypothetical protein
MAASLSYRIATTPTLLDLVEVRSSCVKCHEQPLGGRGSDTEPKYRVDPNNGCATGDERD